MLLNSPIEQAMVTFMVSLHQRPEGQSDREGDLGRHDYLFEPAKVISSSTE